MQWANPHWRRELAAWMHPRRRGDGLTLPDLAIPVAQLVVRTYDMGKRIAAKDRLTADKSPLWLCLPRKGMARAIGSWQDRRCSGCSLPLQDADSKPPTSTNRSRSMLSARSSSGCLPPLVTRKYSCGLANRSARWLQPREGNCRI